MKLFCVLYTIMDDGFLFPPPLIVVYLYFLHSQPLSTLIHRYDTVESCRIFHGFYTI